MTGPGATHWLAEFNAGTAPDAAKSLHACCAAESWSAAIRGGRPYADAESLFAVSDAAVDALDDDNLEQALAAHPRIGERRLVTTGSADPEGRWSREEQSGMDTAEQAQQAAISQANELYEQRFGRVYLICATGRSASELLSTCRERLDNDPVTERGVVIGELAKIVRLRLARLLGAGR